MQASLNRALNSAEGHDENNWSELWEAPLRDCGRIGGGDGAGRRVAGARYFTAST